MLISIGVVGIIAMAFQISMASGSGAHWGYKGQEGPSNWGNLSHNYALCGNGQEQSPINVANTEGRALNNIQFHYNATPVNIVNNGHTIQVNYAPGSYITIGSRKFNLLQFHFHSPSENTVKGRAFPMEMHLVHKADDGQLAVVAVLFTLGSANPFIQSVWNNMPARANTSNKTNATVNASNLLPTDQGYFHFTGSLTTPPCSEGVVWNLLQSPLEISQAQVSKFFSVIGENARPVQPLNDRTVYSN